MTSGRVDEDKWPDVVVAANREIGILYGGKNGVLEPWQKLASWQAGARNELIADLNGDGKPDILFTDGEGKIVILFNEGNRKFSDPTVQSFGKMRMLRAFDFNGDKKLDLIGVEEGVGVKFLLNDGRGTFKESQTVDYNGIWGFAIGDINGSRRLDFAITNLSYQSDHTGISIFSGQSDGSFTPGAFYPLGSQQLPPPLLEDFNGDGKPDLIVCNYWSHNVATALNKGDGTFGPFVTYPAAGFPGMAQSEDFNQDGNLDFVVAGAGSSQVAFYRNHGDGTFFEPLFVQTGGDDIRSCSVADFNQDGWPDIVTQNNASHTISILMNSGSPAMIAKAAADRKRFEQKIAPPPLNFTSGSPVVFEGDATPRLFLMNSDGSRLQQLTRTWGEQPVWSPDGTKIAYREIEKIRIIEANGNALGVIESARRDYKNMDPVWSADSKSVSCRCINVDRINLREFFQWEGSGKIRPIREEDYLRQLDRIALPEGKSLFLGASEYFLEKQGGSLASFSYPLPPEGMDQNLSQASQQVIFARKRKLQIAPFKFDNSGITIDFAKIREIATIQGIQPVWFPNGKELVFDKDGKFLKTK